MKKKFLLIGGALSENHGAEAMTLASIELIREIYPNSNITLSSKIKKDKFMESKYNIKVIPEPISYKEVSVQLFKSFLYRFFHIEPKDLFLNSFYHSDLIIDISGDSFSDFTSSRGVIGVGWRQFISIIFNKKLIIFPQSLGPYNRIHSKLIATLVFNHSKIIFAREMISYKYIKNFFKNSKKIKFSIDTAFYLEKTKNKTKYDDYYIRNQNQLIVGLSVSQSIARYSNSPNYSKIYNEYIDIFLKFINYVIEKYNCKIILIPHVIDNINHRNDDRIIQKKIYSQIIDNEKILIVDEDLNCKILKKLIGNCDLFIGSRMHANIAALSSNLPTIAISYSHKYYGIMKLFNQTDYVIQVKKLNFKKLRFLFDKLFKNRKIISNQLIKQNINNNKYYKEILKKSIQLTLK